MRQRVGQREPHLETEIQDEKDEQTQPSARPFGDPEVGYRPVGRTVEYFTDSGSEIWDNSLRELMGGARI